ncbi:hypothetical protein BJX76DRAFT_121852 [Aspergillus varians]
MRLTLIGTDSEIEKIDGVVRWSYFAGSMLPGVVFDWNVCLRLIPLGLIVQEEDLAGPNDALAMFLGGSVSGRKIAIDVDSSGIRRARE